MTSLMRWMLPVLLAMSAVALSAATIGDAMTETIANAVAHHTVDAHHESLLPAAALAAVLICAFCACAVFAGRARAEAFGRLLVSTRLRVLFFAATAILTLIIVVAMEGYETRFGGVAAFDPRSVLAHHFVPSLLVYMCVAALADRLIRACARAAIAGWEALLRAALPFVRQRLVLSAAAPLDLRDEHSLQADAGRMHPSWSLRAPPLRGHFLSAASLRRIPWCHLPGARRCVRSSSFFFLQYCAPPMRPRRRQAA